ncbi:hypothetical protein [Methylorubrum salsuginis]|uniref:Uncharacterized protein n=1 Tax=Methylorubrum salsuginis TaxID=414703 RepID=A0A1I3YXD8_9HYPH|nr:hypothetical protein [Methylorubrum salsuginis]SFK36493.1 hypothetical protein SAMN04488125_101407 [Methylorubrum salsuginis]
MSLPASIRAILERLRHRGVEVEATSEACWAEPSRQNEVDTGEAERESGGPALPEALVLRLVRVGSGLARGSLHQAELDAVLSGLTALPSDAVAVAEATVAQCILRGHHESGRIPTTPRTSRAADLARLRATPGLERLFVFHPDGYVREAALRALDGPVRTSFEVATLVYRLNDWARPVRAAARDCAVRVFPQTGAEVLVDALIALFHRMPAWQRWQEDQAATQPIIGGLMARPDVCAWLVAHLRTARTGRMGGTLRRACQWPGLDPDLPDLARHAALPSVRAWALRFLIEGRATWPEGTRREWVDKRYGLTRRVRVIGERRLAPTSDLKALIEMGAEDRSGAVRRVAADGLAVHRATLAEPMHALVERLADDKSPSVRWRAAFILKERAAR